MVILGLGSKHEDEVAQISEFFCNGESCVAFAHQKYLKLGVYLFFIENGSQHLQ